jgi:beta-glucosidase
LPSICEISGPGFNTYRFSIEWARIELSPGQFSRAELDYYRRVVECCRKRGVTPAVTFFHSTAPRWFAAAGGWPNPDAPGLFARYCSTAAKALANEIGFAFTINEPQVSKVFRSIPVGGACFAKQDNLSRSVYAAAAKDLNTECFVTVECPYVDGMMPQLIAGHQHGYAATKAERGDLPVGVTLSFTDFERGGEGSPTRRSGAKPTVSGWTRL